jgi:hypothetical protein
MVTGRLVTLIITAEYDVSYGGINLHKPIEYRCHEAVNGLSGSCVTFSQEPSGR